MCCSKNESFCSQIWLLLHTILKRRKSKVMSLPQLPPRPDLIVMVNALIKVDQRLCDRFFIPVRHFHEQIPWLADLARSWASLKGIHLWWFYDRSDYCSSFENIVNEFSRKLHQPLDGRNFAVKCSLSCCKITIIIRGAITLLTLIATNKGLISMTLTWHDLGVAIAIIIRVTINLISSRFFNESQAHRLTGYVCALLGMTFVASLES